MLCFIICWCFTEPGFKHVPHHCVCEALQLHLNLFMLDEVTPLAEHVSSKCHVSVEEMFLIFMLLCSALQGRPGPKGDPGDSGLPGQKVSAALDKKRFFGGF